MPTPAPLTYHQSTFDLIQKQPEFSQTAPLLIAQCEQAYGFAFPAAVREWFSLTQAIAILATYSNQDEPLDLQAIHQRSQQWQASFERQAAPHPTLPFLIENQGVFICAVHLDGSDDPPVKVWDDDEHWKLWSDHFSSFICGWVWDHLYQMEDCVLRADNDVLSAADLAFLRTAFTEVSLPYPSITIYHFRDQDHFLHVWKRNDEDANWWLRASFQESLLDLARRVWQCGRLAETLRIQWGSIYACAGQVLKQLRPDNPNYWKGNAWANE
jgi:SMI1 / KNR4 family (SUKH-1)